MTIIEVTEDKLANMAEMAEKMLKYGGKLMSCLEDLQNNSNYGERGDYGERWDDEEDMYQRYGRMSNRRGSRSSYRRY